MSVFSSFYNEGREHGREWISRAIAVLVLALLFFVTGGGISQHERWKIDRIDITGTQAVDSDDVLKVAEELLKGNYYFAYSRSNSHLFPGSEIEQRIKDLFPRIGRVHTTRVNNHAIAVDVVERKPFALWCGDVAPTADLRRCYFMDDTGFVFDEAPTFSSGVYLELYGVLVGKKGEAPVGGYLPEKIFSWMYRVNSGLSEEIGTLLQISTASNQQFEIVFKESPLYPVLAGTKVHLKDDIDPKLVVKNLGKALMTQFPRGVGEAGKEDPRPLYYIDMRFGNKIFFGFEPEENN